MSGVDDGVATGKRKVASSKRSSRVEARLQQNIKEGKYYEAHQTIRVLYQRYLAQNREKDAMKLLLEGAKLLLQKEQWDSGTEVALLWTSYLKKTKHKVTQDLLDNITCLFCLYESEVNSGEGDERAKNGVGGAKKVVGGATKMLSGLELTNRGMFMKSAIKWTSVSGDEYKYGHPSLHQLLARAYFKEKVFSCASSHFMHAGLPEEYGCLLVELATQRGYPAEADMFIAQAVLQLLVLNKKDEAYSTLLSYCKNHPLFAPLLPLPIKSYPLLNFLWFLILSTNIGDTEVFQCLLDCYSPVISRDSLYNKYLIKIGVLYFNMKEPPKPISLLGALTGAGGGGAGGGEGDAGIGGLFSGFFPPDPSSMLQSIPTQSIQTSDAIDGLD